MVKREHGRDRQRCLDNLLLSGLPKIPPFANLIFHPTIFQVVESAEQVFAGSGARRRSMVRAAPG